MSKHKKNKKKQRSSQVPIPTSSNWLTNTTLHLGLIFAFAFLLYANTLNHEYTQDDAIVIYDNMFTQQGLSGIAGILQNDTFFGFFKVEGKDQLVAGGRYRPLSLVLFAIEYELFGSNPFIGHLGNIVWYGLLGIVLYLLLLKLFKRVEATQLFALIATLLFLAHPLHTEVVANIKGRDEILALLGSLAALLFSLKAFENAKSLKWQLLSGLIFFLGLLSKENTITFLAVVPLTYYFFTKARWKTIAIQSVPFLIAALLFLLIRGQILGGNFGGSLSMELMNNPFLKIEDGGWVALSFSEQMATITYTLGKYLQLLIFPHPLTHDYYPRHIDIMSWSDWSVLLSLLIYISLGILALVGIAKRTIWSYAILYFLITLSIVSNIVFPIGTNMSERFMFMPSVGFCILLTYLLFQFKNRIGIKGIGLIAISILLLSSAKTIHRNLAWKNNFTLFTTDIEVSQNSAKLRNAVGGELMASAIKLKDAPSRNAQLQEAIGHLKEAIRIHPTYKNAFLLLGNAHNYLQQYDLSIQYYEQALRLDPSYTDAINNQALTYRDAGLFYGQQQGDLAKAIEYLNKAISILPNDYETVFGLGVAHGLNGNISQAIELFTKSTQIQPNSAAAWRNLGNAYMNAGDVEKGNEILRKAAGLE